MRRRHLVHAARAIRHVPKHQGLLHLQGLGEQAGADGVVAVGQPGGPLGCVGAGAAIQVHAQAVALGAEDIGKCAYGIFKKGTELIGKRIGIAGEQITCTEMAQKLSSLLGVEIGYNEITPEQYRGFGFPGADDLGNMFQI